jgi:hypothetical protein
MATKNVLRSFLAGMADGIVQEASGEGSPGAVDEQPVFPYHATTFVLPGIDRIGSNFPFDKLLEIVFERQAGSLRLNQQASFDFGL